MTDPGESFFKMCRQVAVYRFLGTLSAAAVNVPVILLLWFMFGRPDLLTLAKALAYAAIVFFQTLSGGELFS